MKKRKPKVIRPTKSIPCFRCTDENNSEYQTDGTISDEPCVSCKGGGRVLPGPYSEEDFKQIKRFVKAQWWSRLRVIKAKGVKMGKKKHRDKLIETQARDLYADFVRMSKTEQAMNRVGMEAAIVELNAKHRPVELPEPRGPEPSDAFKAFFDDDKIPGAPR